MPRIFKQVCQCLQAIGSGNRPENWLADVNELGAKQGYGAGGF